MKVQAAVEVNTENAESALKRVGDAAGQMAERMQREGDKAGAAVDGIGSGASKSADEFSRAEGRIAASIKRATTNLELLGKTASQKLEFKIEERGLDKAKFDPLLSKLRELELRSQEAANAASASLGKVGVSAAQTAAALRGVPAQFTDIATSIAGGQAPLTVFLQQGGQLKDMFGGAGAAAKALGGYVVGLLTPLNLAVAAIGGIGYAAYAGASEMDEFKKNLVLTGNVSGITTDKFNSMAAAMGNISGITRGAAAEALTAMAASGNIGSASIQKLTEAALKFEKAGGPAIADTVKQFEELGKSPVDASVKLSEKTHYLTLAVYEQIKALQDQGKTSEAAAVAQNAWADAIDKRTPQMVQNLGLIEQAWDKIKRSASGTWDFMKDIGRDSTAAEQMADLRKKIADADKDIASGSINSNRLKQQKEQYRQELQALVDHNNAKEAEAKKRAADEAKNQAQISATSDADALIKSQRSKREQHAAELKKLDQQRSSDLLSEEKYQQAKAALAKKYEEKAKPDRQAAREEKVYKTLLDGMRKRLGTAEQLNEVEKLNVEMQEKKYAKLTPMQKANLQAIAAEIDAEKRWQAEGKATASMIEDAAKAQASARRTLDDTVKSSQRNLETFGMSRSEVAAFDLDAINKQIDAERELADEIGVGSTEILRQLEERAAAQKKIFDNERGVENKQTLVNMAKAAEDAHKKAAEKAAAEWEKVADRIDQAFHDAFVKAIEAGSNGFDAFAESIKTSLKAAVADGLYQLTARPLVMSVVGAFSGAQAAPGAAAAPASLSNGFGVISGAQSLWAAYNGGVSGAAATFAKSGFGQAAGLSAAPVELAGPTMTGEALTGTALTGAGSTFAAAAGPVLGALAATYAIAEMQKSGWGSDNNAKNYAKDFALFGGTAGVVVLDRLFGHNRNISNDAQGITGTFDASGFSGQSFQEKSQKGGTFSKDKRWTDYGAIGADMDKALDSMLKQAVSGVQTIGKALNVETEAALEGFSHTFALQLSENGDMSKAGEKIAAELKKVQDELVTKLVPNIEDFARYGESAADTFGRLNQEVTATDAILLAMGKNAGEAFGAVGLASIKAREDLIDLAGGLDKLASKTQAFYQAYYSSSEQQQLAAKQAQQVLVTGFADIGQSIPASRAAFRGLVEAQDLSTEAGRKLWNSLLDLSDEFDTVQKLADAAAESTKAATQSQASLFDSFASDAQKLDAARKLVGDTFASIGKAVPDSTAAFLSLSQSIDPATEAGQGLIAALAKVSNAFAYVATASDAAARATLGAKAGKIEGDMQSLVDRFGSLSPVARTVADDLAATQQQLAGLSDGLANLFGGKQLSDMEKLGQTVNYRTQIRGAISQLNDDIFEAALKGMSRPQQIEQLKKAEADLWAGMSSAADKGQQASQIRSVVLRRLGLESDEANSAASKVADLAKQARQDQIETLRTQIDGMQRLRDLAGQIADFSANLSIGDLSTLDFTGQLAAAKQLFEQTATAAASGDTKAQGNLTANARTYLEEARAYFASSSNYAAIYDAVNGQLKSIAGTSPTDSAISNAQTQIDQLQKLPDVMASVVDTSQMQIETLRSVQSALRSGDEYLSKSIDKQTEAMQQQIDALHTLANNQQAQIVQAGAAYTAMTEELRQVKAKLAAIESNGALAGAA